MSEYSVGTGEVLAFLPERRRTDQSIARLVSSSAMVQSDVRVAALYAALSSHEELQAVGVVDPEGQIVGIIVRRDFMATMAKPYAQDVFRNHPISEVMSSARTFSGDTNVFSVSEEIAEEMRQPTVRYYLLTWSGNRFAGIFSSQDMLVYLSGITQSDIAMATNLQSRIVRDRYIAVGERLELIAFNQTAKGVGGDFYNVTQYAPGHWLIALCDVSGKGVAASVITSVLWGMMSIFDFREGIAVVNRYLVQTFEAERFVTAVIMDYDESTGRVDLCDLGHSHLFLARGGALKAVKTNQNNLPLGIMADVEPVVDTVRPHPSDVMLLTTDGLMEQANLSGEEYGIERAARVFADHGSQPVEIISDRLAQDFNQFRGKHPLGDDVTWTVMRFAPQEVVL